uniref:Borealin-2-like n=1 Tax=Acanthochromis polyacanthus TaxID=80966 RepID=A0A3Q1GTM4_9TELE
MPVRKKNTASGPNKEQLSRDVRRSRLTLFIQQFEKEAQERTNGLEAKMENMLATVDKAFKVELMKMPPSLQNTLIGDLIRQDEALASEVSIAMKNESREMPQPLKKRRSKRLKSADSPSGPTASSKVSKGGKGAKRTRTLVGSNSAGNLIGSAVAGSRTQTRLTNRKTTEQTKGKLRSVVSTGDLHCLMAGAPAHITVTTAQGQTFSFSEETKNEINVDLLDDVAWCQIQKLMSLMDYLSRQSRCSSKDS